MSSITLPFLGLLTLGAFGPVWAADPLAAVLPEDSALFFNVRDLTRLRQVKEHPLLKTLTAGDLGKLLEPVLQKLAGEADAATAAVLKEETGLTPEELLAKFPGGAAASFSLSMEKLMEGETVATEELGVAMVADFLGDEVLMEKVLGALDQFEEMNAAKRKKEEAGGDGEDGEDEKPKADWPEDYEETVTEVAGVKVHEWTVKDSDKMAGAPMAWSVTHGKAVLGNRTADIKEIISRMANPTDKGSIASTAAWKSLPESARESDLLMGINLEHLLGEVQEGLRVKQEKGELNTGLPVNPLQVWTGLGLDQFRLAFVGAALETEDAALHLGLTYAEKPALLKIYAATGPGTPPAFVPDDAQEASWGTMDWGKMFDQIKELAMAVSPMAAGGMEMGLAEVKKKIGVDLRTDLLGQMGDDLWSVSQMDPPSEEETDQGKTAEDEKDAGEEKADGDDDGDDGENEEAGNNPLSALALTEGQSQVIGIALRDSKAFNLSLKSMFNTIAPGEGLFEDREFMGLTIHQVKGTPDNMSLAWLIHNDTMILSLGKTALLEKILAGMEKKPARPLVQEPHVKAALAKLPDGGVSSTYADAGKMIDAMLGMIKPLLAEQAEGEAADFIENLPDQLDLPWALVSRTYLGDRSMDVRIRLSRKP